VVEWDETLLRQRAANIYVHNILRPLLQEERGKRQWVAYAAALRSPADRVVEVDKVRGKISIQPIDLKFEAEWKEKEQHFKQKVLILNRLWNWRSVKGCKAIPGCLKRLWI
jgi:hypothetical protein